MPQKETYGAQPPLELIRQYMDHGGWYERKSKEKPFWRLEDLIMVAAMGPPGGGRAVITARLQRHYNIISYTDIQFDAITVIYSTIVNAFFAAFTSDIKNAIDPLIEGQLEIYDQVLNGPLKPTPSKPHYTFNLRDISKIFQGIVSANQKLCTNTLELSRIWIHENKRVFGDRLINNTDRVFMDNLLLDRVQGKFALSQKEVYNAERIIFGDFMEGIDVENRVYKQIEDLKGM